MWFSSLKSSTCSQNTLILWVFWISDSFIKRLISFDVSLVTPARICFNQASMATLSRIPWWVNPSMPLLQCSEKWGEGGWGGGSCPERYFAFIHRLPFLRQPGSCFSQPGPAECCSIGGLFPCDFPPKSAPCLQGWPQACRVMLVMNSHSALVQCSLRCDLSQVWPPGTNASYSLLKPVICGEIGAASSFSWEYQSMVRNGWLSCYLFLYN